MLRTPKGTRPEMTSLCTIGRLSQWTSERTTAPYILRDPQQQQKTVPLFKRTNLRDAIQNLQTNTYILYIFLAYHTI